MVEVIIERKVLLVLGTWSSGPHPTLFGYLLLKLLVLSFELLVTDSLRLSRALFFKPWSKRRRMRERGGDRVVMLCVIQSFNSSFSLDHCLSKYQIYLSHSFHSYKGRLSSPCLNRFQLSGIGQLVVSRY